MTSDLETAVQVMHTQFSQNPARIAVGGASLGANIASCGPEHPEVPALILLSPGLQYAGIESEEAFRKYASRPVFIAASPGDGTGSSPIISRQRKTRARGIGRNSEKLSLRSCQSQTISG